MNADDFFEAVWLGGATMKLTARSMLEVLWLIAFGVAGGSVLSTPAASNEWPTAHPESVGLAPNLGEKVDKALANRSFRNVHAVVLVRHGKLVLERYRRKLCVTSPTTAVASTLERIFHGCLASPCRPSPKAYS
jgi:hypothetical protein